MSNSITEIKKRSGRMEAYQPEKIKTAITRAYASFNQKPEETLLQQMMDQIESSMHQGMEVEEIQDLVETTLMKNGQYQVSKAYILYRSEHAGQRRIVDQIASKAQIPGLVSVLKKIQKDFTDPVYDLNQLAAKFNTFWKAGMSRQRVLEMLEKAAVELISREAPKWEEIAARLLSFDLEEQIRENTSGLGFETWHDKLKFLADHNLLGKYLIEAYSPQETAELEAYMKPERNDLLNHSGMELLARRYLIRSHDHLLMERIQEMFMGIAMHLAMPEKDKVKWAKKFYDILSTLKVTMATPTMSNSRKPFHQMSSCFIDTVEDSLTGIYKSLDNFATVSKYGGGMGLYLGKVRANGSRIRGFDGAAGGVIRWIKLINDTAVAVDQLGVRQGAAAVYLDAWHKDLPEFLQLRTNNGDDRMKAHDIFPAVCFPDLFWKLAQTDLDAQWVMMCPHEIWQVKGYHLEDCYGQEWEEKYKECVADPSITRRVMPVREIVRMLIKSLAETGTPFVFNRDLVNEANPNSHKGMIYSSNLCTEIAQNMAPMHVEDQQVVLEDGSEVVVTRTIPGEFVVCNLASLSLGKMDVNSDEELEEVISTVIRALDNVIDLNYYPLPYARITNQKYRPIGLGTSGYQHMLVKQKIPFESQKHLDFADQLYEKINYYALKASMDLAEEKGKYDYFEGSEFENGAYFQKRGYTSEKWKELEKQIRKNGLRNGYLMAIAPTSSTSIIAGTTAAVDPVMKKYFMEEKKGSMITRVAPDLSNETFWYYKNAHHIDQNFVVDAAGIRARHIDQAQSVNLYITTDFTYRQLMDLYIRAWQRGVKSIYYVRSQSLEVEDCESCSA